jgi:hypothetical protein
MSNPDLNNKRLNRERKTVRNMIALFCCTHHTPPVNGICTDCQTLVEYAIKRIERCPFGASKPTCAKCPVHCYEPLMREQIRQVMRTIGPRMLLYHPYLAVLHLLDGLYKPPDHPLF